MKRLLSYGQSDFVTIRQENRYFVDKTGYIRELEEINYPVFLRPRRFGKTMFTEILRCYSDCKMAEQFAELFGGLDIGKNPTPKKNSYYFLSFDFSGLSAGANKEESKQVFNYRVYNSLDYFLRYYKEELQLDDQQKKDIIRIGLEDAAQSLNAVINAVHLIGGKIFVAIDEYDSLTNALALKVGSLDKEDNEYRQILSKGGYFRAFFETLKSGTNRSIAQVYITGILPITISDMNSGFNIASFITMQRQFANMLGFTETELSGLYDEIASDYQLPLAKQDCLSMIRRYYDGYRFLPDTEENIYNPMMSLYFLNHLCRQGEIPAELIDHNLRTQYNQVAYIFGTNNHEKRREIIETLTADGEILLQGKIDVVFNIDSILSGKYVIAGLYYLGLLTWKQRRFLRIPNLVTYEMILSYFELIQSFDKNQSTELSHGVNDYILSGDIAAFCAIFFEQVIKKFPGAFFRDANESFYRGLFFHILYEAMEKTHYDVYSEFQASNGRIDFYIRTHPKAQVPCIINDVIEIKRVKSSAGEAEFSAQFNAAIEQVKKRCFGDLADCRAVAICFRGNEDYKIYWQ